MPSTSTRSVVTDKAFRGFEDNEYFLVFVGYSGTNDNLKDSTSPVATPYPRYLLLLVSIISVLCM
jgi:hypothetical protein